MASFDEKSIFKGPDEEQQALDELNNEIEEVVEEELEQEEFAVEDGVKILAIEHVETKKEKKIREKKEAKEKK